VPVTGGCRGAVQLDFAGQGVDVRFDIAAILVGVGVWQRNILFLAFIVIAEILVLFWGNEKPRLLTFILSSDELKVGTQKSYPLREIAEFSFDENGESEWARFFLRRTRGLAPLIRIYVPKNMASHVRSFLGERFPEKEWEPSFSDTLEKFSKF